MRRPAAAALTIGLAAATALLLGIAAPPPLPPPVWTIAGRATQGGLVFGTAPVGTVALSLDGAPVRLTGDRRFVVGFGRDAPPRAHLEARFAARSSDVRAIDVSPRAWQIESIPGLRQPPPDAPPNPEYDARRAGEVAEIAAARTGSSDETGWSQAFAWPATGRISGVFGSQRILGGVPKSPHLGLDIAAPAGTPVVAPADGTVRVARGPFLLEGNLVMLDHGRGLVSAFVHLSRIDVRVGEHVARGTIIGAIGMTGRATGPHLHWGLSWNEVKLDPELLVGPMP